MQAELEAEAERAAAAKQRYILSELDKYKILIKQKIMQNWYKPPNVQSCVLQVRLGPGGIVIDVMRVSGDNVTCQSATSAVYKSAPLPVSSDPEVFAQMKQIQYTFSEAE